MGKTSSQVKDRYNAKAYDNVTLRLPKGRKAEFQAHAIKRGESLNGLINRAIAELMEREGTVEQKRE